MEHFYISENGNPENFSYFSGGTFNAPKQKLIITLQEKL